MRIKLAVAVACAVFAGAACSSNVAKPPTIDTVPLTVANTVSSSVDDTASVPTLVTVAPNTAPVETLAIPTSVAPAPLEPDVAEANTIKGTLYLDINSDGVHDANEPGIPNIVVSAEHETSVTNSAGRYSLRNQAGPVTTLRFSSAWFRTQCDSLNCPAGPGKDNNIPVVNQLLVAHDLDASAGLIVNAGLRPDWPAEDGYPLPPSVTDVNAVDVALRLSRTDPPAAKGECQRGQKAEHLCNPGDHGSGSLAIHNQGTLPISDVLIAIETPVGMRSDQIVLGNYPPSPPGGEPIGIAPFDPMTNTTLFLVKGPIPPAAVSYIDVRFLVDPNVRGSDQPYRLLNPYERQAYARLVSLGTPGEADSVPCNGWGNCITSSGPHNKLEVGDEMDESGWSFSGPSAPVTESFSLAGKWVDKLVTGEQVGEIAFTNTGNEMLRNVILRVSGPKGMAVDPHNPMWTADVNSSSFTTIWPGQVSPKGAVKVQFVVPTGAPPGALTVEVLSASTSRHPEGVMPFEPTTIDFAAFNLAHAVILDR